jgi:uncharacterized membrane protein
MTALRGSLVPPTRGTRLALELTALTIVVSATYLILQYPSLPWLLPVRFESNGLPSGWQYRTMARVLMPVFVQLALALTFGAVSLLLLSRPHAAHETNAPDVRAAAVAAEAVSLIALIWVGVQGYAAWALARMWTAERAGLGWYGLVELSGLVMTLLVAARAHLRLRRPLPRPYVAEHWRFGKLYKNPADPALFVPTRDGSRWTLNFGRPIAAALLGLALTVGIIGPTLILGLPSAPDPGRQAALGYP